MNYSEASIILTRKWAVWIVATSIIDESWIIIVGMSYQNFEKIPSMSISQNNAEMIPSQRLLNRKMFDLKGQNSLLSGIKLIDSVD
jgi:hypothetical protein